MRLPGKTLWLLMLGLVAFFSSVWLKSGAYQENRGEMKVEEVKLPLSFCGWMPWWDYKQAEEEFLANKELFEIVSPFVFLLNEEGEIEGKIDNLADKIKVYKSNSLIKIVPSIYNDFDGERVSRILNSRSLQQQHIKDLVELIETTRADGIEIDYEYLKEEDRDAFSLFIKLLAQTLHREGKLLVVTLHPKTSKLGNWYGAQAQDWQALGKEADFLRIMVYDFSWETSKPGPIAPLWWVEKVISFAKTKIPQDKIVVGLPLYGYDWLADSKEARELSLAQIEEIIQEKEITVGFDPESNSPFFDYQDEEEKNHQVWFENKISLSKKIEVIQLAGLSKICLWRLGGVPQTYYESISQQEVD